MKLINNRPIIILIYLSYLKDEVNKQQTYYNINIFVLFRMKLITTDLL